MASVDNATVEEVAHMLVFLQLVPVVADDGFQVNKVIPNGDQTRERLISWRSSVDRLTRKDEIGEFILECDPGSASFRLPKHLPQGPQSSLGIHVREVCKAFQFVEEGLEASGSEYDDCVDVAGVSSGVDGEAMGCAKEEGASATDDGQDAWRHRPSVAFNARRFTRGQPARPPGRDAHMLHPRRGRATPTFFKTVSRASVPPRVGQTAGWSTALSP